MPDIPEDGGQPAGRTADAAQARLAVLRVSAAQAYDAITDADAALRVLAQRRVAAERELRHAAARQHAAARAAAVHARARPGLAAQLSSGFRARREWRAGQAALEAAVGDAGRPMADAQRSLSQVKGEFAAQVRERADAAAALLRLTAQCAATQEEIAGTELAWADASPVPAWSRERRLYSHRRALARRRGGAAAAACRAGRVA